MGTGGAGEVAEAEDLALAAAGAERSWVGVPGWVRGAAFGVTTDLIADIIMVPLTMVLIMVPLLMVPLIMVLIITVPITGVTAVDRGVVSAAAAVGWAGVLCGARGAGAGSGPAVGVGWAPGDGDRLEWGRATGTAVLAPSTRRSTRRS